MRPTTTGGKPKKALIKTTTSRRPRKGTIARAVPTGKLTAAAMAVAARLTLIESPTISRKSPNPWPIQQKGKIQPRPRHSIGATRHGAIQRRDTFNLEFVQSNAG